MKPLIRFQGKWHSVNPRPLEPPRQTYDIAWKQIKENKTAEEVYREWFAEERAISQFLYQSKDGQRNS
jgi:hypothetical protein